MFGVDARRDFGASERAQGVLELFLGALQQGLGGGRRPSLDGLSALVLGEQKSFQLQPTTTQKLRRAARGEGHGRQRGWQLLLVPWMSHLGGLRGPADHHLHEALHKQHNTFELL